MRVCAGTEQKPDPTQALFLFCEVFIILGNIRKSHNPDIVLFQPVIDLQQVGDRLRGGHELSVPRLGIVLRVDETGSRVAADDLPQRCGRIPHQLVEQL